MRLAHLSTEQRQLPPFSHKLVVFPDRVIGSTSNLLYGKLTPNRLRHIAISSVAFANQVNALRIAIESMNTILPKIILPELFFGFVAPIGADVTSSLKVFRRFFEASGYAVVEIKVTDIFHIISKYVPPKLVLKRTPAFERYDSYIKYGNQLREHFSNDAVLAEAAIRLIARKRVRLKGGRPFSSTVYLIHQFKRKEEIDLLRSVYGQLFLQISVYSRRGARVEFAFSAFLSLRICF